MGKKYFLREENISTLIYYLRGEKVMLDSDLAELYGIETKHLKEAVRRNIKRFPDDFMFELTKTEFSLLRNQIESSGTKSLRSQFATSKRGGTRYLPMAFTEQGVAMLSGVLKSPRAIDVNVAIMRTFVQVRRLLQGNKKLSQKIKELEKLMGDRFSDQDKKIELMFESIRQLIQKKNLPRTAIGFRLKK
jgi:hypothetical protein